MVYPVSRSENKGLEAGMSDGKYKKVAPNRGGIVEAELAYRVREDLHDIWFGIHECSDKVLPDTTIERNSLEYAATKPPQIGV